MATVPITGAAGVACLAAAAGAKSWLRAHRKGGPCPAAGASASASSSSHSPARGPSLDLGHAVALFDCETGYMVTVRAGGAGGSHAVELRRVPAVEEEDSSCELPAFPAEALFVVVAGRGGQSVGLRSVG
jgi:hypothetical protein